MKLFRLFLGIKLLFLFYPLSLCATPETIKVAALLHLTGEYAQFGKAFREGIELATEEINNSGGVKGKQIKLILEDTQYNMKTVNTLAQKVIHIDKVPIALISNYTEVMVAGPAFERAQVPLLTVWDSSPEIEDIGDYVFGIGLWAPSSSQSAVDYAVEKLQAKTAVVVATNGQWSLGVAENFTKAFTKRGGRVVKEFIVNPEETDFNTITTKIRTLNPELVYAPLSDHQVPFWQYLEKNKFQGHRITSDCLSEELTAELGPIAEGIFQTQMADPQNSETQKMLSLYTNKYKRENSQVFMTALGYDSIKVIARAIEVSANLNPENLKNSLYKIKGLSGAAGELSIDAEGSSKKKASMFQVRSGKFVKVS